MEYYRTHTINLIEKYKVSLDRIFSTSVFLLFSLTFQSTLSQISNTQKSIQGIPCAGTVQYFSGGKLKSCILAKDYSIDGNVLPAGSKLFFWENGSPSECWISKDATFYGQIIPAKSSVFFNRWGHKFCFWLPFEMTIQGHLIASTHDGIGNSLHSNGKLEAIWLAKDEIINGIPCSSSGNIFRFGTKVMSLGTKRMVWFYDNGKLHQAMVSNDVMIQGHLFKKGEIVNFDKNGKIDLNARLLE